VGLEADHRIPRSRATV